MKKKPSTDQPYHGTIILDANVIYSLFCPVKEERLAPDFLQHKRHLPTTLTTYIQHYLGFLEFLSKNGFHIVIPEMVSVETGSVLKCGTDMIKYANLPKEERPRLYDTLLVKLLQKVAKNKYPNIEIVATKGQKQEDAETPEGYVKLLEGVKKYKPASPEAHKEMNSIRKLVTKNFGEKAIINYIKENQKSGLNDVFVLSDDKGALDTITKECNVPVVNLNAFVRAFVSTGLHEAVGLKGDLKPRTVLKDCAANRTLQVGKKQEASGHFYDMKHSAGSEIVFKDLFLDKMHSLSKHLDISRWRLKVQHRWNSNCDRGVE
jgi:hypothetical protein